MLIVHIFGIVLSLGSIASFLLVRPNISKINAPESVLIYSIIKKYLNWAFVGMGLMILSGGYLMTPYWEHLGSLILLQLKLVIVLIWMLALVFLNFNLRKALQLGYLVYDKRIKFLAVLSVALGMTVVSLAVFAFH